MNKEHPILTTPPPNMETLSSKFGVDFDKGLIVTYYPNIHVKHGQLPGDLLAHESTHLIQQEKFEGGVKAWWDKYLSDPQFRLTEESTAYAVQVKFIRDHMVGRSQRRAHFKHIVDSFVRMYGGIVTREQAKAILNI